MKKHTALKQNVKNNTCIEFRRDIKALTLLADTTSSGNLFHSWSTRTEKKIVSIGVPRWAATYRYSKMFNLKQAYVFSDEITAKILWAGNH